MGNTWLIIRYRPTTLFSLRMSHATSSGGKSLLVPTPYAYKLAMVDAAVRCDGLDTAKRVFDWIKDKEIRFRPPEHCVVTNTFIKILRKKEIKSKDKDPVIAAQQQEDLINHPFGSTIAYREFCFFCGELAVAIDIDELPDAAVRTLRQVAAHINYLGKRGSFMQYLGDEVVGSLPSPFTCLPNEMDDPSVYGIGHFLDDIGATDARDLFDRINTYGTKSVQLGKHRIMRHYLVPYVQRRSSRGYTYYRRGG